MPDEQYTNKAATTLSAAISSTSATTLTVTSATGFPTTGDFRILIDNEILLVTGVSGTTFTVTRGQEGTTAATHASAAAVTHVLTAASVLLSFRRARSLSYRADDFRTGTSSNGAYGELGWSRNNGSGSYLTAEANHPGIYQISTGTTSGTTSTLALNNDLFTDYLSQADMYDLSWLLRLNQTDTNTEVTIGLSTDALNGIGTNGVAFEKRMADTTWWAHIQNYSATTRNASNSINTGVTVTTAWTHFRIRRKSSTQVEWLINDVVVATSDFSLANTSFGGTISMSAVVSHAGFAIKNGAAVAKTIDIDLYEESITLTR